MSQISYPTSHISIKSLNNIHKITRFQGCTTYQSTVNIRLGKQNLKTTYTLEKSHDGGNNFHTVISDGTVF